jgi:4-oxalocrotonate tautomerase
MPIIQCDIREGRSDSEKSALGKAITEVVHETIGAPIEHIYVLVREQPASHFTHAGEQLASISKTNNDHRE